jgi:ParB family chromosome partitioning protein
MSEIRHIDTIRVEDRHRQSLGDLTALVDSIKTIGLINPITITPDGRLIAGHRRLEAHRRLGRTGIPVRVVDTLTSARDLLVAERDENTCRLDMKPSELVALVKALEKLAKPAAEKRMLAGTLSTDPVPERAQGGRMPPVRDIVAEALGTSHGTYERAKSVVAAVNDPDPEIAAVAADALREGPPGTPPQEPETTVAIIGGTLGTPRRPRRQRPQLPSDRQGGRSQPGPGATRRP